MTHPMWLPARNDPAAFGVRRRRPDRRPSAASSDIACCAASASVPSVAGTDERGVRVRVVGHLPLSGARRMLAAPARVGRLGRIVRTSPARRPRPRCPRSPVPTAWRPCARDRPAGARPAVRRDRRRNRGSLDHVVVHRSHVFLLFGHHDLHVAEPFLDPRRTAAATRMEAPHHDRAADLGARHDQPVDIELMIVLGVGDGAFQRLADLMRDAPLAERQRRDRPLRRQIADHRRHQIELPRAGPHIAQDRLGFVIRERAFMFRLAHVAPIAFAHVSPASPSCPPSDR